MIGAGQRDVLVTFEAAAETDSGGGGRGVSWSPQFSRWVAFAFPSLGAEQEGIAAGAVEAPVAGTITVEADGQTRTITAGWRAVEGGRTWNIRRVRPEFDGNIRMAVEMGVPT